MNPNNNNSLNDIIPPKGGPKRSIRDIPVPERKQNKIDALLKETEEFRSEHSHTSVTITAESETESEIIPPPFKEQTVANPRPAFKMTPPSVSPSSRKTLWLIALVTVLVLAGAILMFWRSAEVDIALKIETIPVDINVAASGDATSTPGILPYKVIPVQKEGVKEVAASGAPVRVDEKASGTIVVYNNHSAASQQLVATTRFETADGKVYRIDKAITVPGTTVVNGQTVPGSVEAVVFADQPGASYNIDRTDFTIPGFRGTDKYEGFYARSKTAMTGGFSGNMPQVSDADLKAANDELRASLAAEALADIQTQKPEGYAFFKDGAKVSYTSSIAPGSTGTATVTGRVTAEGLVFEVLKVEDAIAESKNGERYHFDNLESLSLSVENGDRVSSFISNPDLALRFSGTLTSGQSFDEEALKNALSDKSKDQLQQILQMYPEIERAEASIKPFWSSTFPKDAQKIKVNVTKEQ